MGRTVRTSMHSTFHSVATVSFNSFFFLFPSLSYSNCLFRRIINVLLDPIRVAFSLMSPFQKLPNIPLEPCTVVKGVKVSLYPLLTRGYIDIVWCNRS